MGIAAGTAAAKAKDLCIDNRVTYTLVQHQGFQACWMQMLLLEFR